MASRRADPDHHYSRVDLALIGEEREHVRI
jgi:hypothetical protein